MTKVTSDVVTKVTRDVMTKVTARDLTTQKPATAGFFDAEIAPDAAAC